MPRYSRAFYDQYADESARSARRVIPWLIEALAPSSVIDVGCGIGTWLSVFRELGVTNVFGVDGSYVDHSQLRIPADRFVSADLARGFVLPVTAPSQFDIAISLEVAEHLHAEHAETFVARLVSLAPVVVFSAAIPRQGGDHHVNEQWPDYWSARFEDAGYRTVDWLRPRIWNDADVAYYYAQNTLLFVAPERLASLSALHGAIADRADPTLARVHPRKWLEATDPKHLHLRHALAGLPYAIRNMLSFRVAQLVRNR
ncbi:MAG: class I SAM-dependent methyltransferase [Deltaproteobacteria bacterium]|nr:class I SAM-dependent methyltransferase [Deltaproteobacteria bacterium]